MAPASKMADEAEGKKFDSRASRERKCGGNRKDTEKSLSNGKRAEADTDEGLCEGGAEAATASSRLKEDGHSRRINLSFGKRQEHSGG